MNVCDVVAGMGLRARPAARRGTLTSFKALCGSRAHDAKPSAIAVQDFRANQQLRGADSGCAQTTRTSPLTLFRLRRQYFVGTALKEPAKSDEQPAPVLNDTTALFFDGFCQDPTAMMGNMKQQMAGLIPHFALMGWVSFFFSGFVISKLPSPLTDRFARSRLGQFSCVVLFLLRCVLYCWLLIAYVLPVIAQTLVTSFRWFAAKTGRIRPRCQSGVVVFVSSFFFH